MLTRNLSINQHFRNLAQKRLPKYRFCGITNAQWRQWRETLCAEVMASLGSMPTPVPLNPEIVAEWEEDGLLKQRVWLDVEEGLSVTAWVYRPADATTTLPAIIACHGHGADKDSIMGIACDARRAAAINEFHCDYGLRMAKAGYVVIAIDWRGFGERDDRRKPHCNDIFQGRDICNIHYLRATLFGQTMLGANVHDGKCAIDYLCSLPCVDSSRIGAMGLSFGGTMTMWLTLCDSRIKAANIICYADRFAAFAVRDANFCGSQITPGLFSLCDIPDLHGLIAPRPLLVDIGTFDDCFLIESAISCYRETEKIYAAADASDKLELNLFEGGHSYSGRKTCEFFRRHLGRR